MWNDRYQIKTICCFCELKFPQKKSHTYTEESTRLFDENFVTIEVWTIADPEPE